MTEPSTNPARIAAQLAAALSKAVKEYNNGSGQEFVSRGTTASHDIGRFSTAFSYGWIDAGNPDVFDESSKSEERAIEYASMNGPDRVGAWSRGYAQGWSAREASQ